MSFKVHWNTRSGEPREFGLIDTAYEAWAEFDRLQAEGMARVLLTDEQGRPVSHEQLMILVEQEKNANRT